MRKTKSLLIIALLLLVGATSGYVANTYAKYTAEIDAGTATATVAKWNFDEENASTSVKMNLGNYTTTTLADDKIAPGTCGSFALELSNTTSETAVAYTVSFSDTEGLPQNLKFYSDDTYTEDKEIDITGTGLEGVLYIGDTQTVEVHWDWPYDIDETEDAEDTADGKAAETLEFKVNIKGVQLAPEEETGA